MRRIGTWALMLAALAATVRPVSTQPQAKNVFIPPPLRLHIPFQSAWQAIMETLDEDERWEVDDQDVVTGRLSTGYVEYIDGPLTKDHIAKIGQPIKLSTANWIKARYRFQIWLELIAEKETMITVDAEVQGMKRELLGDESWVDIRSNGRLETELLNKFGSRVFGSDFSVRRPKRGFWEHSPEYVPRPEDRVPQVASPERPPR